MARSSGKRKRTGGRKSGRKSTSLVNKSLTPFSQRYITKMKYSDLVETNSAGRFNFNLNSIFDPNQTGIGRQPYGHDTCESIYNRYRVISCSYRIQTMMNSNGVSVNVGALPSNEIMSITNIDVLRENPRARYITQNAGAGTLTLSGKVYLPSLTGRNKVEYMADDRYQAQFGSNPVELAILNLLTTDANGTVGPYKLQVLLEYTVECFDIKNLPSS